MEKIISVKHIPFGHGRVSICVGRGPFNANAIIVEHREDDHCWNTGSNAMAVTLTPRLETTGKEAASSLALPNDPEILRDLAEHLLELADEMQNTLDQHMADRGL